MGSIEATSSRLYLRLFNKDTYYVLLTWVIVNVDQEVLRDHEAPGREVVEGYVRTYG